jgi:hypothetical protein
MYAFDRAAFDGTSVDAPTGLFSQISPTFRVDATTIWGPKNEHRAASTTRDDV